MTPRLRAGFTLVEILVAMALLGAVLLALNTFVFSMGEIWGRGTEQRLFDQHVRAVTRHVESLFRRAALAGPPADNTAPIGPQEIRTATNGTVTLLTFELPAGDRTLPWPEEPLPDVVCSLDAREGAGLVLYWHSRLETKFDDDPPRATVLTPFGTAITYDYYDPDARSWHRYPALQKDAQGKWLSPDRIVLRFNHGKLTAESTLVLPRPSAALPAF
jgi:prepilin-type N-terminal cleavage/methylation domain-containing protein